MPSSRHKRHAQSVVTELPLISSPLPVSLSSWSYRSSSPSVRVEGKKPCRPPAWPRGVKLHWSRSPLSTGRPPCGSIFDCGEEIHHLVISTAVLWGRSLCLCFPLARVAERHPCIRSLSLYLFDLDGFHLLVLISVRVVPSLVPGCAEVFLLLALVGYPGYRSSPGYALFPAGAAF